MYEWYIGLSFLQRGTHAISTFIILEENELPPSMVALWFPIVFVLGLLRGGLVPFLVAVETVWLSATLTNRTNRTLLSSVVVVYRAGDLGLLGLVEEIPS